MWDGTDAAQKLAILAQIAFGVTVPVAKIPRIGITQVQQTDIRYAHELGYRIKLLAEAWLEKGELALHVTPVLLRNKEPLAQVRGPYNAIEIIGDAVGDTLYYGRGAGQMPTASAVVADIIRSGGRPGTAHVRNAATLDEQERRHSPAFPGLRAQSVLPSAHGRGPPRRLGGSGKNPRSP